MVISGTHSVDLSPGYWRGCGRWKCTRARLDKAMAPYLTKDSTFAIVTYEDGTIWSMNVSWALPCVWPAEVYSLELGIVGTGGVLTIDDTHRDIVFATAEPHESARLKQERNVSFLTSYPPGDLVFDQLWGPMREETRPGSTESIWASPRRTHRAGGAREPHAVPGDGSFGQNRTSGFAPGLA